MFLGFGEAVSGGEDGIEVLLDGGGALDGLEPVGAAEGIRLDGLPEAGFGEEVGDGFGILALEEADEIGGDADLEAVHAGFAAEGIEGVREEVFAAAGGAG